MSLTASVLGALLLAQAVPAPPQGTPARTGARVDEDLNGLRKTVEELRTELDQVANKVEENADTAAKDAQQLDSDLRAIEQEKQDSEDDRVKRLEAIEATLDEIQAVDQTLARGETAPVDDVLDIEATLVDAHETARARSSDLEAAQLDSAVEGIRLTLAALEESDFYRARLGLLAAAENLTRARESVSNTASGETESTLR